MDSPPSSQEASPFLDFVMLMEKLEEAATIPMDEMEEDAERDNPHPDKIYMRSLHAITTLIKWAEISKDAGMLSAPPSMATQSSSTASGVHTTGASLDEWTEFINAAESKISRLCSEIYANDYTTCVDPFAVPTQPGCYIRTKGYMPGSISNSPEFLLLFADIMDGDPGDAGEPLNEQQRVEDIRRQMALADFIPSSWAESLRPHSLSTKLARFNTSYDSSAIPEAASRSTSVGQGIDSSVRRQQLINILQARAEVRQDEFIFEAEGQPRRMALGKNMAVICDEKRKLQRHAIYPFGYDRSQEENEWDWDRDYVEHGFASRVDELKVDSIGRIWAASGSRIKAFGGWAEGELEKEKRGGSTLKWTLNSAGYSGAFGVTDELVFRAGTGGRLAFWKKDNLVEHQPVLRLSSGPDGAPNIGPIEASFYHLPTRTVEVSEGELPHYTVEIPNLVGPFGLLSPIPGTSKYISTPAIPETLDLRYPDSFSVRMFDISSAGSPASIVGLGFGAAVASLATHIDIPHVFVAAGDDRCTRIFDLRHSPLPQIMLNGHSDNVNACTIASHGGDFPILFTGGNDELIKAWDIRHTKNCLYDLSTGTMHPTALAWHEDTQSLFLLGKKVHKSSANGGWPKRAARSADYFGIPWCTLGHLLVEYRFRTAPDPRSFPWTPGHSSLEGPRFDLR
ncbi:hypothetical protein M407DRAFT_27409 [Tulasnella calospora MUT 4182]|uniref:Uncharacterized protein n=1 Tax=Tulasnella calospora MUT 4182 TaxID=1051891 RepID=A0A0C3QCG8_9AGAM|nr:hypothetical protein M407DRAFT_27409 [Tulasnella calospora MUT 4182]